MTALAFVGGLFAGTLFGWFLHAAFETGADSREGSEEAGPGSGNAVRGDGCLTGRSTRDSATRESEDFGPARSPDREVRYVWVPRVSVINCHGREGARI